MAEPLAVSVADPVAEYEADLVNFIAQFRLIAASGKRLHPADLMKGITPRHPSNGILRDFAKRELGISERDFAKAEHRAWVHGELGFYPETASSLVEGYVKARRITCAYNGILTRNEIPYVETNGVRDYDFDGLDAETMAYVEYAVMPRFRGTVQPSDLMRDIRVEARRLGLTFSDPALNDAGAKWVAEARAARLPEIIGSIYTSPTVAAKIAARAALVELCAKWFQTETVTAEFCAAVLLKFMQQVKRKMLGRKVFDHLMPVFLGRQGQGKSTMIHEMLAPVAEVTIPADFAQITDIRNITMWSNFVMFVDEMARASKADIDTVKNVITAESLTRRPMGTNFTEEVRQNTTFIGAANATDLSELIRDPTGMRRFVALPVVDHPDWSASAGFDWFEVWRSIGVDEADPMRDHRATLREAQEETRDRSRVECWASSIDAHLWLNGALKSENRFTATRLFADFAAYEEQFFPGPARTSIKGFGMEMASAIANGRIPFKRVRATAGTVYVWTGPLPIPKAKGSNREQISELLERTRSWTAK